MKIYGKTAATRKDKPVQEKKFFPLFHPMIESYWYKEFILDNYSREF